MTQPITYFVQNDATVSLCHAFGAYLQHMQRDHQICIVHALTTAMLAGGSFIDCLIDSNAFIEESFPDSVWEIAEQIDEMPELMPLIEAIVHVLANPVAVSSAVGA